MKHFAGAMVLVWLAAWGATRVWGEDLEALVEVLAKAGKKYILDPDQGGILPLLSLGDEGGAK